jgi:hypothetical protein
MTFRRYIAVFAFLQICALQILLAQHFTVHLSEDRFLMSALHAHNAPAGHHDDGGEDKACAVCTLAKNFSQAIDASHSVMPPPAQYARAAEMPAPVHKTDGIATVPAARGPPAALL